MRASPTSSGRAAGATWLGPAEPREARAGARTGARRYPAPSNGGALVSARTAAAPVISATSLGGARPRSARVERRRFGAHGKDRRSEEHTSELQSRENLVCRLL